MNTKYRTMTTLDRSKVRKYRRRRKIAKNMSVTIALISLLYIAGIAGGLEQDVITMKESILYSIIGIITMLASVGLYNWLDNNYKE